MMNIQKIAVYKHNTVRPGCFRPELLHDFFSQVKIERSEIGPKVSICGGNADLAKEVSESALELLRKKGIERPDLTSLRPVEHHLAAEVSRTAPMAYAFLFGDRTDYVFLRTSDFQLAKLFNAMKKSPSGRLLETFNWVKYETVLDQDSLIEAVRLAEENRQPIR